VEPWKDCNFVEKKDVLAVKDICCMQKHSETCKYDLVRSGQSAKIEN